MTTLTAPVQTPETRTRRKKRDVFLGKVGRLAASIRKASQKAEAAILQTADRKWFEDNPENEPGCEFPSANDSHPAEAETALDTLLSELKAAIEESRIFS